jgi:hypothetical protein
MGYGKMMRIGAAAVAVATMAVAGCWPFSPPDCEIDCGGPSSSSSVVGSGGEGGGVGGGGAGGGESVTDLFVDPGGDGDDNAPGTLEAPLKTLRHALLVAEAGTTVHLFAGSYGEGNGDDFVTPVPDDVTIAADVNGAAALVGTGVETALDFANSGNAMGLRVEGFAVGVRAAGGPVRLSGTVLTGNSTALVAEGVADVTMFDSLVTTSPRGLSLSGAAKVSMRDSVAQELGDDCAGPGLAFVDDAASLTLDGVDAHNCVGSIALWSSATAKIVGATLENIGGCAGSIQLYGSSQLELLDTALFKPSVNGALAFAILATESSDVVMSGGSIVADYGGIYVEGTVTVAGAALSGSNGALTGIDVESGGSAVVQGATIQQFGTGVRVVGWAHIRGSQIVANVYGVRGSENVDLGTSEDPGGNTLQDNTTTGLLVTSTSSQVIQAIGNTWIPSNQGTDANGHFLLGTVVAGPFGANTPAPRNVGVSYAGPSVKLAANVSP